MFKATYTYICVANFSCTRSFFSYLYSCPHSLFIQIAGSYIYICIYTYIFLRVEQTDPDIPLSPNPPTLRPFFSLYYPCRVTVLMVALYLYACNRYIRIHVDVHHFVYSRRSNCATMTLSTSVCCDLDSAHVSSM